MIDLHRRSFLFGASAALVVPARTFHLPPPRGWRPNWMDNIGSLYAAQRPFGMSDGEFRGVLMNIIAESARVPAHMLRDVSR